MVGQRLHTHEARVRDLVWKVSASVDDSSEAVKDNPSVVEWSFTQIAQSSTMIDQFIREMPPPLIQTLVALQAQMA